MPVVTKNRDTETEGHLKNSVGNGGERATHSDIAESKYVHAPTVYLAHHLRTNTINPKISWEERVATPHGRE